MFGWILHAYVLLGNHYHLLLETPECTLSQGMHWLNGCYAQWFNRKHRRVGHLFQGRFKGILVEKQSHLLELARYVVLNPVRAKMVEKPGDWRWSSYRATAGLEAAPPFLTTDWILGQFGATKKDAQGTYGQFVDEGIGREGKPWKKVVGQIYLGSAEWVETMQTLVETEPRSDEIPQTQRTPMRPGIEDVLDAVTSHFSTSRNELKSRNAGRVRRLAAHLAWREGLIRQRKIAEHLGVGNYTTVSAMIKCSAAISNRIRPSAPRPTGAAHRSCDDHHPARVFSRHRRNDRTSFRAEPGSADRSSPEVRQLRRSSSAQRRYEDECANDSRQIASNQNTPPFRSANCAFQSQAFDSNQT